MPLLHRFLKFLLGLFGLRRRIHDPAKHKLGRGPVRKDPRTLLYAKYRLALAITVPQLCNWLAGILNFGEMLNDQLGCCTCSAAGHMEQCWTASNGEPELTVPDSAILTAYEAQGYRPGDPSTDNGAVEIDVLNYWRGTGIGGRRIASYVAMDPKNMDHLREAIFLLGGAYVGLSLPVSAQYQDTWDVPAEGTTGEGQPGGWGGHAVCIEAYDAGKKLFTCVTWGQPKVMTEAFLLAYLDEAYAVLSPDWIGARNVSASGFDLAQLQADLAQVAG